MKIQENKNMDEKKYQKRLTWAGIASLASIPLTGVIGLASGAGMFIGKGLRLAFNKKAREDYMKGREDSEEGYERGEYTPRAIKRDNKRRAYVEILKKGSEIVEKYLKGLSKAEHSKISKIKIIPRGNSLETIIVR